MAESIYDNAHVTLSRLVGREHNNPLGDDVFPLLRRLLGNLDYPPRVLDVGCGRGRTALWWAAAGATVVAFDPSSAMLEEAKAVVDQAGLLDRVSFAQSDLRGFQGEREFDLVIVHDVLCYSDDRAADLARLLDRCRPGGVVSSSDYFGDATAGPVAAIVRAWGIEPPLGFDENRALFEAVGAEVLLVVDTTRQYSDHWRRIRGRLESRRDAMLTEVGADAVERMAKQIDAIEAAVADGRFGHMWSILARSGS